MKNWCFWTVMLEKTLESPLECKEIQLVHPKGDQFWVIVGGTDIEAETPILWPPDAKSWLIWKDHDLGKDWRQEEKGMTEDEMVRWHHRLNEHEVKWSEVAQSCPTLCDPMNRSMPGLPVHHHLLEFTQIHVHRVCDAIQPPHPLSSPSPPAPNPSQYQGLFQWVNSLHEVAKVLEFQLQHQSFQWTPRADLLQNGLVGSPYSPRDSQESSPTPQFKSIDSSVLSLHHSPTLTSIHDHREKHNLD